ncbi:MAG: site-specific integrase, partial [Pseudomonadota bacterium]|nr:site-specific integrase [Pseudomonadota bacterium]
HCLVLIERIVNHGLEQHPPRCKPLMFKIKKPKFDNRVTEFLEPEQLQALLTAIDADLERDPFTGRAMLLALSTGMRRGALLRLKWADISFTRDNIHLRDAKSDKEGKAFDIPLNEGAKRVFKSIPKTGSPYVFPGDKGGQRSDFNRGTRRIREAAGLPKGFRPLHGLRHHYASALVSIKDGSVDIYTLQKLMTHSDTKTTERYATIADERLKTASANASSLIEKTVIQFPKQTEAAG